MDYKAKKTSPGTSEDSDKDIIVKRDIDNEKKFEVKHDVNIDKDKKYLINHEES